MMKFPPCPLVSTTPPPPPRAKKKKKEKQDMLTMSDSVFHTALCSCPPPRQGDRGSQGETPHTLDRQLLFGLSSTKQTWTGKSGKGSQCKKKTQNPGGSEFSACSTPCRQYSRRMSLEMQEQSKSNMDYLRPFDLLFFSSLNERNWNCTAQT